MLKEEFNKAFKQRCLEAGFSKKGNWYYRQAKGEFHDLLNVSYYSYSCKTAIGLFAGIRNLSVEGLYERFTNNRLKEPLSMFCVNIGYLGSGNSFKDWCLTEDIGAVINEVTMEIKQYANPFYSEYGDIPRLIKAFENMELTIDKEQQFFMLPLLYYISNQKEKGMDYFMQKKKENFKIDDYKNRFMDRYTYDL